MFNVLEAADDPTGSLSEEEFFEVNETVTRAIVDDCDSLCGSPKGMAKGKAAVTESSLTNRPEIPKRRGIKPEDLHIWKYRNILNLEEETGSTGANFHDEVDRWRTAYEEEKHKTEASEKSNLKLKFRLLDCQKKIRAHKQKVGKQQKMLTLWEERVAELKKAVVLNGQENNESVWILNQSQQTHAERMEEYDDQQVKMNKMQAEVVEYKRLVAAHSSDEDQLADDQIRRGWENIFNRIRNIAVRLCKGAAFDYAMLPDHVKTGLVTFVPSGQELSKVYHIDIVISIISWCLMSLISIENTFGESTVEPFTSTINIVRHIIGKPSRAAKLWIETTRKLLVAVDPDGTKSAASSLIEDFANRLQDILSPAARWNKAIEREVRAVFNTAFEMSQSLLLQRNEYQIRMLPIHQTGRRSIFETALMAEAMASPHEVEGRPLEVSVFPGLYKINDEMAEVIISYPKVVVQQ